MQRPEMRFGHDRPPRILQRRTSGGRCRARPRGRGHHCGPVIAGDIGNARVLEYSVIGDTVDIASRLENLTRSLNSPLVVSGSLIKTVARR